MAKKSYPDGTRVCPWILTQDGEKHSIRRWIYLPNGKKSFERFSAKRYEHIRELLKELQDYVVRLNGFDPKVERLKTKVSFKHAFISDALLTEYAETYLAAHIPNRKDAKTLFGYLKGYALNFFISQMHLASPLEWHRHQHTWGKYLLNRDEKGMDPALRIFQPGEIFSAKVLRYTVSELNRFMNLHLKRPDEIPLLTFDPISRAAYKKHDARRKMTSDVR